MGFTTFSPGLVLIFVWVMLWMIMDLHFSQLTPRQKWLVPLLILSLAGLNHLLRQQLGRPAYLKTIIFTMHLPFFLIFKWVSKCSLIKMLFVIFTALIFTVPTVISGMLVGQFFSTAPPVILLNDLLSYAITLLLIQFVFRKGFNYLLKYGDDRLFLQYSIIPLLFYIYTFAKIFFGFSHANTISGRLLHAFPFLQVLVFYFLLMHTYRTLSEKKEAETAQASLREDLAAAEEQISLLQESQSKTAVYQHDMRHHLNMIDSFLLAGEPKKATEYIHKVRNDIEAITPKRYCENELVNLLCSSFSGKAERLSVQLRIHVQLPKDLPIPDTELCTLLSNGLENALNAVAQVEESRKYIDFYCEAKQQKLLIEMKNPYHGEIVIQDGLPVSPQTDHGYGCQSIRTIVQRHRGLFTFETEEGIFILRVALPIHAKFPQFAAKKE